MHKGGTTVLGSQRGGGTGDSVVVMKDTVLNSVVPVGWPPLKELLATTIKNQPPIFV